MTSVVPIISYENANSQKLDILKDNEGKTGIYRWTNILSKKSYVDSAINLFLRFKNYYNISYLEKEVCKNNSLIYKALLKYRYSKFKLDIIEYCPSSILIKREQYYIDILKPEYNILNIAGSLLGFKHSKVSTKFMSAIKLGHKRTEETKLKILIGSKQAQYVSVINNYTLEKKEFLSIRKAAIYIYRYASFLFS